MAKFTPGTPKPANSGRKKGTPNRKTAIFRDLLETNDIDIEKYIADAMRSGNIELLKALQGFLPYLHPRLSQTEVTQAEPQDNPAESVSTADLLKFAK